MAHKGDGQKRGGLTICRPLSPDDVIAAPRVPPQDDQCRARAWADHLARRARGGYDYASYYKAKFGNKAAPLRAIGEGD